MIGITLTDPGVQVVPLDGGKLLVFTDTQSGITVQIPMPDDSAKQIATALEGAKVDVVPASALANLKVAP